MRPFSKIVNTLGITPQSRHRHSAVHWRGEIIIWGGIHTMDNLVHMFNINTAKWKSITTHNPPTPRGGHTAVIYGNSMFIFGGSSLMNYKNSIVRLDLIEMEWKNVNATGTLPSPRAFHSCVLYRDSFYIFGGLSGNYNDEFFQFNIRNGVWTQILPRGRVKPPPRCNHSAIVLNNSMFLYGGSRYYNIFLNDFYKYDFDASVWTKLCTTENLPPSLSCHSAAVFENKLYITGLQSHFEI